MRLLSSHTSYIFHFMEMLNNSELLKDERNKTEFAKLKKEQKVTELKRKEITKRLREYKKRNK